ncbi:CU044_2847 family protein [Streptomyces griseoruber]|uniref:Trypsin-co-occurring domain-containing protein n=1 Tax=Streptomyces griseoruber TaxID=1943 RepID=A0A101SVK7_9ACTN|nr:CU044_2847 family protein [Streptomyces griseoruber]KUN80871.1 hypothetical protein AQJ64_25190 [Streptomyces griseoruber]
MSELVRFPVAGADPVVVEVDSAGGAVPVGPLRRVREVDEEFTARLGPIREAVARTLESLRGDLRPDEITVSFGVSLTGEAGAVIAKTALEANFSVEMVWSRDAPDDMSVTTAE